MRLALDTNVMAYAEGLERAQGDASKRALALRLVLASGSETIVLARQALAELHAVLVRKAGRGPGEAATRVRLWAERGQVIDTDEAVLHAALTLATEHGLQIFDALILAAAAEARSDLLLSEDLHDGFAWRGVTVANPFSPTPHPRLSRLLA